ncbi:uncharacterized protein LOC106472430 [Limulus polyphemus]|uniref:Uncharacterized protein LOC106472430 n=1 Tax=Limulus polyphemus TaxID=6850 RepID=A0ABM1TLF5_LIMPO|nr:uncharacterized protein LOC106472430 [Limulus polyphemus]XP_022256712.1 uncharacterized protein LOC106472430 [Limulus polyphemus]XP_022256713.1 uncharacterized protein LOC106472430 [Limulus polyphemus]
MSSDEDFNENCGKNGQNNNRKRRLIRDDSELDDDGLENGNFSSGHSNEDLALVRKKKTRVLEESDNDDDSHIAKKRQNCDTEESVASEDSDENVNSTAESESENDSDDEEDEESEEDDFEEENECENAHETEVSMAETSASRVLNEIETDSDESDGQSEMCPVCLNKFRGQEIGTPESCDHSFCLECLLEWSRNVNTCPIDRQRFSLIFVRLEFGGKICKRLQVENMFHEDDEQQAEDNTYCEICGMADREDRLLLCDACDFGYHCECLDPPLEEVPVEEWFCPDCLPTVEANHQSSMPQEVLDDFREMLSSNFRPGAAVFRRVIPRTRASENVRSRIQRRRIARESADENERVPTIQTPSSSVPRRKKKIVRRKSRKIKTRKRRRKTTKKVKTNTIKKKSTTKRRRKRKKKRKTRRSKAASRPLAAPLTVKKRIAEKLGLMKPPVGQTLPVIKRQGPSRTIHSIRSDIGISALSLFGDRDELDVVNESFEEENGDVCIVRPHRSLQAKAHAKEILSRASLSSRKNVPTVPSSENLQNFDLLGSILQTQSLLHSSSQDVRINKDGTLKSRYSSLTLKSPNGSIQKRPQDPTSQSTSSKETSTQGYSKSSNISQENISAFTGESICTFSSCEPSRTSKDNSCDHSPSRPTDGQCSSFHSHHRKEKHKHSHKNEKKHLQIEEDVDIYSDIESLGEDALMMDEESTDHQFSLPSCANFHINSHIGNLEEGSDSSENELVIDEDVKDEDHNYSDDENVHITNFGGHLSSENVNDEYNKDKNVMQEIVEKEKLEEALNVSFYNPSKDNREKNKDLDSAKNAEKGESGDQTWEEGRNEENQENRLSKQVEYISHKMDKREICFGDEQGTSSETNAECIGVNICENDRAAENQLIMEPREGMEYLVEGKSEEDEEVEEQEDNDEETEDMDETEKIETDDDQENEKEAEGLNEMESTVYNDYQEQNDEGTEYIDEAENVDYDVTEEQEEEEEVVGDVDKNVVCEDIEEQEDEEEKKKEAEDIDENVKCGDIQEQEDEEATVADMDEDENVENEDIQEDEEATVADMDEDENVENEDIQEDEEAAAAEDIDEDENVTNDNIEEEMKKDSEDMDENKNVYDYDVEEHNIEEQNKHDNLESFDAETMEEELEKTTRTETNRSEKENSAQQEMYHSEQHHVMHQLGNSNENAKFPHQISLNLAGEVEDISEDENEMVCEEGDVSNDCNKNINISYKFSKEGYSEQDDVEKNVALLFAEEETNRRACRKLESKSRKKHKTSCKSHHIHLDDEAEEGEIVEDTPIKRYSERQKHSSRHKEQEEIEDLTDMAPRINVSELPRIPKIKNVEMDLSVEHCTESKRTSVLERIDAGCSDISWKKLSKSSKDRIYRDRKPKDEKLLYQREIKGNKEGNKSYKLELDRWKQDGWSREGSKYQKLDKIQKSETDRWKQDDKSKEGTKAQKSDSDRWKQDDKYKRTGSDRVKERSEIDLWKEKTDVEVPDYSRFSKEKKVERHLEKPYDKNNERREWRTDKNYDKNIDKHDKMYKERHKTKDHKEESSRSKEKEKHRRHSHEHISEKSRERECRKEEKVKIFTEKHEGRKEKTDKHEKRHHDKGHRHHDHKKRKNRAVSPYSDVTSLDAKEIYAKGDSIIINVNFNRNTLKECEVDECREDKTDSQSDIKFLKSTSLTENNANQKNTSYNNQNNILEENTVKQRSKTLKFSEDIWEVTPTEIPLDEDFQLEKDTITIMSDDGLKFESFGFENRNSSDSEAEVDCHKRNVEQNLDANLESSGKENILSISYDESNIHTKKKNQSRTTFPHSPSYPFPVESDSYDPCEPTKSPTSHHEASYIVKSVDIPSMQDEKPKPPPSPELPPLPTEPEPEEPPLPEDSVTCLNFKNSENSISVSSVIPTSFSSSSVATPHISRSPTFSAPQGASVILPNLRVPPPNFVPQNVHSNSSANNGNLLNSGGLPSLNQHVGTAPPHMMFTASHLQNVMQGGIFSTQHPPSNISSANVPGASHLGTGLPPPNALPVFSQVRSQNVGVNITLPSSVIMTNVPPPNIGLLPQMSLPNLRQPPPPLPASVQGQMYSQSKSIVSQGQIYSQSQGIVSQGQIYSQSQGIVSMTQTKPVASVIAALLPRVSAAQVTKQQPQEDVTDVVDMDVESPYSPDSPVDSPLLELDEKTISVSQNNSVSVAKDSFESLISSEKVTSSHGKRSHESSKSKIGKSKNGDHQSLQSVEFQRSLESHSRQEVASHISKKPKQDCRSEISKHKHCIRFDVIDRSKLSSSVTNRKDDKKGVMMKMDETQLKILDELPSSAVEMQVKEKFLKKLNRQERVVEEVKLAVKPYYNRKEITKDEYKEILRKSVPKICHNKSGEINPVKIKALVEGYVKKFKYQRRKSMSGTKFGKTS